MRPYFHAKTRQALLQSLAMTWLGTPYRHQGQSRNGTDCAKFLAMLLVELGVMARIDRIEYGRDFYHHGNNLIEVSFQEQASKYLISGLNMELFEYANQLLLIAGDILLISAAGTKINNHAAMYLGDGKIIHCLEKKGVFTTELAPHWSRKTRKILRLMEAG